MQHVLVFDVDGTLTASRRPMDGAFAAFFRQLVERYPIYLVTGSDWGKLCEQVPGDIREGVRGVFCCSGNELWHKGVALFSMSHSFPDDLSPWRWNWSIRAGFRCVPGGMSSRERVRSMFQWLDAMPALRNGAAMSGMMPGITSAKR